MTFGLLLLASSKGAFGCDFPPREFSKGDWHHWKGDYVNLAWRYSVTIPAELVGLSANPPFPQHDFSIVIKSPRPSYLTLFGEANSLEYRSPTDKVIDQLKYLREDGKEFDSVNIVPAHLGTLRGLRTVIEYKCEGSSDRYFMDWIVALSPGGEMLYEVRLYSHQNRYEQDRSVLDKMVKTWKYLGPRP